MGLIFSTPTVWSRPNNKLLIQNYLFIKNMKFTLELLSFSTLIQFPESKFESKIISELVKFEYSVGLICVGKENVFYYANFWLGKYRD